LQPFLLTYPRLIKAYDFLSALFIYEMEDLIAQLRAACLIVTIENQTITLCIDAHLSGDVTHLAFQEKSYAWNLKSQKYVEFDLRT